MPQEILFGFHGKLGVCRTGLISLVSIKDRVSELLDINWPRGPMARRLTTRKTKFLKLWNQEIAGSIPAAVKFYFSLDFVRN